MKLPDFPIVATADADTREDGCPAECGLCSAREQHSCLPIIEITNHCNLECPICIVQNKNNYEMSLEEFRGIIDVSGQGLVIDGGL